MSGISRQTLGETLRRRIRDYEYTVRVNADEGEQLITNDGINCFATWIDENGNIRCGMRGGDNG